MSFELPEDKLLRDFFIYFSPSVVCELTNCVMDIVSLSFMSRNTKIICGVGLGMSLFRFFFFFTKFFFFDNYTQVWKCIFLEYIYYILLFPFIYFAIEPMLILVYVDINVILYSKLYMYYTYSCIPAVIYIKYIRFFFIKTKNAKIAVYPSIISLIIHTICCFFLIKKYEIIGLAISYNLSIWTQFFLIIFFSYFIKRRLDIGFSFLPPRVTFCDLKDFLLLSRHSIVISFSSSVNFEMMALLAARAGYISQTLHIILCNVYLTIYTLGHGCAISSEMIIKESKNDVLKCKRALTLVMVVNTCLVLALAIMIVAAGPSIVQLFTDSELIFARSNELWPLLASYYFIDTTQLVMRGGLRAVGGGGNLYSALVTFVGSMGVSLPLATFLVKFYEPDLIWIWIGLLSGAFVSLVGYILLLSQLKWDRTGPLKLQTMTTLDTETETLLSFS
eukprot:GHVL01035457.1.p1 GENE.GHVL01035457.1~~GHVL01035457.1.p1  ORF type:complete len:447 (+),score=43.67 GHVL01035457.1:32-1372(+)